ncbi:branched-chain amino acid aminotransferase [Candidatus Poribacteria bacterium]|nr:branched-chain amino acid aminotransferase [Candidatus Poribacteria bacterium]
MASPDYRAPASPEDEKMSEFVYLNDELVTVEEAKISVLDHGFWYGNGLFETMRAYKNYHIFRVQPHLDRLLRSAEAIRLKIGYTAEALEKAIVETLAANGLDDAGYVRLTISPGAGAPVPDPTTCEKPTVLIVVNPFVPYPEVLYQNGASAIVSNIRRNAQSPIPRLKSLNYLENILARFQSRDVGAQEAIFLDTAGYVAEGSMSNIFFVKSGELYTPSTECPILPGITREVALEVAFKAGISIREGQWTLEQLLAADEAFLTNSLMELMPLTRIDSACINNGKPGELTRELITLYKRQVEMDCRL